MKERLAKLLSVKSIVTIGLTAVFIYLAAAGRVSTDQFMTVFSVVIAFYFGTQHEKATVVEGVELVEVTAAEKEGGANV